MKTTFSAFILATFLAACTSNTRNEAKNTARQNIRPIKSERPFIDINKFKVRRLRFFDIEKWGYEETNANLIKLSKNEVKQFFQDSAVNKSPHNVYFYFTIQENTSERKSITILETDESCCCNLHLLTYNKNNKLISDNIVAGSGGDGGWGLRAYGTFLSKFTYQLTTVEEETIIDAPDSTETEVDSIIVKFKVDRNLMFQKQSEMKYKYNKVRKQ